MKGVSIEVEKSDIKRAEEVYLEEIASLKQDYAELLRDAKSLAHDRERMTRENHTLRRKLQIVIDALHVMTESETRGVFRLAIEEADVAARQVRKRLDDQKAEDSSPEN